MDKITEQKHCENWIRHTYFYGKGETIRCGKIATNIDTHGRNLCGRHYNKWLKKVNKQTLTTIK